MKLRFPGCAEIISLFTSPTTVSAAVVDLTRAMDRVNAVVRFTQRQAARQISRAAALRGAADTAAANAALHASEGERALRVAENLKALVS